MWRRKRERDRGKKKKAERMREICKLAIFEKKGRKRGGKKRRKKKEKRKRRDKVGKAWDIYQHVIRPI